MSTRKLLGGLILLLPVLVLLAGCGVVGPLLAPVTEFALPQAGLADSIALGSDGNLWVPDAHGNQIDRITPTGVFTTFPLPTPQSKPSEIIAGSDGNLWFLESGGNRIGKITPVGITSEFALPTAGAQASDMTAGPDGNLWFEECVPGTNGSACNYRIGRITPTGALTEFALPPESTLHYLVAGPDGNLWFTASSPV